MALTQPSDSHQLRRLAPGLSPASLKRKVDDPGSQLKLKSYVNRHQRQRKSHRRRALRTEDDRELAADRDFALPSDRPRLQRQEAFRVPSTQRYSDASDDDRDLYRLGLLYDDVHLRGSGFNLDSIDHPEPVYSIRHAKRTRKHRNPRPNTDTPRLALDFRSGSLFDDLILTQLLAPGIDELPSVASGVLSSHDRNRDALATRRDAPLEVIHESQESSLPSPPMTPVVTSLPDLVMDDGEDGFTLLGDEISDDGGEYGAEDVSSVTGDPWIMLGDGS